jgi:hypothetical protein
MSDVIKQIDVCIKWLDANNKANNLLDIAKTIDRIAVLSVNVGHMVSEAFALQNDLEDEYKGAFAKFIAESTESVAKAEVKAEAALLPKNGYKKLSVYLDRLDKVIESYRQFVSVSKMDMKNS